MRPEAMTIVTVLRKILTVSCIGLTAFMMTGCRDYFARKDTVNFGGGNAVAENKVAQTINPWPRESFKKTQVTNGERLRRAAKKYEDGPPKKERPVSVLVTK